MVRAFYSDLLTCTAMCYRLALLLPAILQEGDPHTPVKEQSVLIMVLLPIFYAKCDIGKDLLLLLTTTGWKAVFILSLLWYSLYSVSVSSYSLFEISTNSPAPICDFEEIRFSFQ